MKIRALSQNAWQRAPGTSQPVALAAIAAAIAWVIAHRVLGHPQPFFAPIAALFGTDAVSLGLIVFITMIAARGAGAGAFGEGMMFANQAAASAILIVTPHRRGTGGERVVDAVGAETSRIAQIDLLANAVLGIVRDGGSEIYGARPLPAEQRSLLAELTDAIHRLAATPQPWPPEIISSVERRVPEVADGPGSDGSDRGTIVASVLRAATDDLGRVIDQTHTDAEKRAWRRL